MSDTGIIRYLELLHEDYAFRVNSAVAEGRMDLVRKLSDSYIDEATRAIIESEPAHHA